MSTADAIDLARRAIVHAAHRDAASGNIVRSKLNSLLLILLKSFIHLVYHMKETGWEKIEEKDTNDYMYQYREEKTMNF
jgi:20S proteasome alpha/beta subunit